MYHLSVRNQPCRARLLQPAIKNRAISTTIQQAARNATQPVIHIPSNSSIASLQLLLCTPRSRTKGRSTQNTHTTTHTRTTGRDTRHRRLEETREGGSLVALCVNPPAPPPYPSVRRCRHDHMYSARPPRHARSSTAGLLVDAVLLALAVLRPVLLLLRPLRPLGWVALAVLQLRVQVAEPRLLRPRRGGGGQVVLRALDGRSRRPSI